MLTTIIYLVIAICLLMTIIFAFQKYVTIPGDFAWIKGIIIFILVCIAVYFIWDQVITGHMNMPRSLR